MDNASIFYSNELKTNRATHISIKNENTLMCGTYMTNNATLNNNMPMCLPLEYQAHDLCCRKDLKVKKIHIFVYKSSIHKYK